MLWIAFLILVFAFGLSLSQKFFRREAPFAAFPVGVMFSTWVVFLLSFLLGFNLASIGVASALLLLLMLSFGIKRDIKFERYSLFVFILSLIFFSLLNHLMVWNFDGRGNALSAVVVDVDYHSAIISSMAWGDNFPPLYPYLPNMKLTYHFLFDFFSAILIKLGSSLPLAMQIPNTLVGASFVTLLYIMLRKLDLGKRIALLATFLILFNGNFGFIEFFREMSKVPQEEMVPSLLKMGAASTWMPSVGYAMANTITEFTLNQRMFMVGICAFALVIILLIESVERNYLFAALITGLMPLFHIYSFAATLFFSFPILMMKRKELAIFLILVALLSIPQVMYLREGRNESYVKFKPGWVGEPQSNWLNEKYDFLEFWLKNFSLYIILAALGMFLAESPLKLMTALAFVVFILLNIFVTQPLVQDNRKWLLFVLIFFSASSSVSLSRIAGKFKKAGWFVGALLVLMLTLAGVQSIIFWVENYDQVMFYRDELQMCEFVRNNTESDALILSNMVRDCVNNWGGRGVFLRLDASSMTWHMGHGVDITGMKEEMGKMLGGDCELIKRNGVGYILLDSRNSEFSVNNSFLDAQEKLYERDTFSFYRVRC